MSLVNAIDTLLAYVDEHELDYEFNFDFEVRQFEDLDRVVYVEAHKRGFVSELPPQDSSSFSSPPTFLGKTNLPGNWLIGGRFVPTPTRRWRGDLLALRTLAAADTEPVDDGHKPPPPPPRLEELRELRDRADRELFERIDVARLSDDEILTGIIVTPENRHLLL